MIPQDLHFSFLSAVYLIFFTPLFVLLYLNLFLYRKRTLENFAFKDNLTKLILPRSKIVYFLKGAFFCIAWVLLTFALMQPKGDGYYANKSSSDRALLKQKAHDVIFLIDASASMSIMDSSNSKTRLEFAKEIADETISLLSGENASLYAFTSLATKMSPVTPDLFFVRLMLRMLTINEGGVAGTNFTKALSGVREKYLEVPSSKQMTLIVLSDGGDTSLTGLESDEKIEAIQRIVNSLGSLNHLKLNVHTIGIGTLSPSIVPNINYLGKEVYSGLEEGLLQELAKKGNGSYTKANDFTALDISKDLIKKISESSSYSKDELKIDPKDLIIYHHFYGFPLTLAILLLIFYLIFPNRTFLSKIFPLFLLFHTLSFEFIFSDIQRDYLVNDGSFIPKEIASAIFEEERPSVTRQEFEYQGNKPKTQGYMHLQADLVKELQSAKYFFEAEDSAQAKKMYENLLEKDVTPFEKAIVLYNLGTLYLNENDLKKASDTFELISFSKDLPIFLKRRIKTNLSIAKYREALLLLDNLDENNLEKAVYLLKFSEKALNDAIKDACNQDKLEGRNFCVIPKDLDLLSHAIQKHLQQLSKQLNEPLPTDFTYFSLKQFNEKIKEILNQADTLKVTNMNDLKKLLGFAIQAQTENLKVTRQLGILDEIPKEALDALKEAQKITLKIADRYLKEAYAIQKTGYENHECQKKPWKEILPLYNKGYKEALEALDTILLLAASSLHQEEAIKYWKMANQKSNPEKKEEKKEADKTKTRQEKSNTGAENALQLLQDMQSGEKMQKTYPKSYKQEVDRPW